jgi:hypothetical protein
VAKADNPPVVLSAVIYFQPASSSQVAISAGCVFSRAVIESVSSGDIVLFMHEHYAADDFGSRGQYRRGDVGIE